MNIVILAAGLGKRMKSPLPKVLHRVAGRPMLAHVIESSRQVAAVRTSRATMVVVTGHGAEQVRAAFSDHADLEFVLQQPQHGTGHAVVQTVSHLRDDAPTLVLYGDVPLVRPQTLTRLLDAAGDGVGILTVVLPDPTGYGRIVRDAQGDVQRIVEQKDASADERAICEINTGILCAPTAALKRWLGRLTNDNAQREYYLTDVIAMAVADGVRVAAVASEDPDEILGVNSKDQLATVERIAQARAAAALMEAGATLLDPARIDIRGNVTVGAEVVIDVNCVFEGEVKLGDGVRIGPHNVLRDCTIGAGTEVFAFCHLENATVGANARIGPYARTRATTTLGDEVHIGNFVEVKNSTLAAGAKANHLSYVGDASVGRDVNIGAGTIVANYDGANKHRTVIEDNAHTGSNSVLVAPITVGAGATVGAGSTVTRAVPAGKLTVARARQQTIEGWERPVKRK